MRCRGRQRSPGSEGKFKHTQYQIEHGSQEHVVRTLLLKDHHPSAHVDAHDVWVTAVVEERGSGVQSGTKAFAFRHAAPSFRIRDFLVFFVRSFLFAIEILKCHLVKLNHHHHPSGSFHLSKDVRKCEFLFHLSKEGVASWCTS